MRCKNCGAEVAENAKFCSQCAAPVERPAAKPISPAGKPAPAKKKRLFWTAGIVLAVCLAVAVIAALASHGNKTGRAADLQLTACRQLIEAGDYEEAIDACRAALAQYPDKKSEFYSLMVGAFEQKEDYVQALSILKEWKDLCPEEDLSAREDDLTQKLETQIKEAEEAKQQQADEAARNQLDWLLQPNLEYYDIRPINNDRPEDAIKPLAGYEMGSYVTTAEGKTGVILYNGSVVIQPMDAMYMLDRMGLCGSQMELYSPLGKKLGNGGGYGKAIQIYDLTNGKVAGLYEDGLTYREPLLCQPTFLLACQVPDAATFLENFNDNSTGKYVLCSPENQLVSEERYNTVSRFSQGLAAVEKNGKWGFVRADGTVAIPFAYDSAGSFHDGVAPVKKDGKWGYIKTDGSLFKNFVLDEARSSYCGRAWAKYRGRWGVLSVAQDDGQKEKLAQAYSAMYDYLSATKAILPSIACEAFAGKSEAESARRLVVLENTTAQTFEQLSSGTFVLREITAGGQSRTLRTYENDSVTMTLLPQEEGVHLALTGGFGTEILSLTGETPVVLYRSKTKYESIRAMDGGAYCEIAGEQGSTYAVLKWRPASGVYAE